MTKFMKKYGLLSIAGMVLLATTGSALATKLLHRNIAELTTLADRIFVGVCLAVETKTLSIEGQNLLVTEYTFEVTQTIKGVTGSTLVFRQFGPSQGAGSIVGMPAYQTGKRYMLFLGNDSEFGLTSPIGFGQGAFLIFANSNGTTQAINAFGNRGLFNRMDKSAPVLRKASMNLTDQKLLQQKAGPVRVEDLTSFIEKLLK